MSMDAAAAKPAQSPVGAARCRLDDTAAPAEAAPRQDGPRGQALELSPDLSPDSPSSEETSPIGLSLLYQKRVRQREMAPITTAVAQDLENQAVETSPIGKALLDRKRYHARRRLARERGELSDATGCCLNEPTA